MNILVIGGSYFFGRWFVQLAHKNHNITVINRGNVPVGLEGVTELKADRHDVEGLKAIALDHNDFDCAVDFCAYNPGDIKLINEIFNIKKYIFISTVDVYKKGTGAVINEDSEMESKLLPGDVGAYIYGKVLLEAELSQCCQCYASVRPGIIYGPANYAPRENLFFGWIKEAQQIIVPNGADGEFQFIYVADAAKGLIKICESENILPAYNFCNSTPDTYTTFAEALHKAVEVDFAEVPLELPDIIANEIPLPFPLTKKESEKYDTKRFETLGVEITPLYQGLKKAYSVLG